MKVDCQHAIDSHGHDHVCHNLGTDGDAGGAHAAVLAGVAKVGNHCSDAVGRGAMQSVCHQHKFHQAVIGRRTGGLNDEDILAPHILLDLDIHLAVAESADSRLSQRQADILGNLVSQCRMGIAGKHHQVVCHGSCVLRRPFGIRSACCICQA